MINESLNENVNYASEVSTEFATTFFKPKASTVLEGGVLKNIRFGSKLNTA